MKQFFALYVKELKANRALFLFLLLLIVGINAYGLIQLENFTFLARKIHKKGSFPIQVIVLY